ncbi:hypothetical protein BJ684DRAFT_19076 [Piptocephalis cylindrospora]|uniref:Transmembrane protein 135 N-terminal domain-containing protein n=1 Tax=Piptocephalis cylindrospora TaxID=1907219 RepID=A0A4P9Y640_9FUNG|nr:hypothetical protein BJ684DRAFT_19076 [Piptocephalis cylindrospora]|eukprot:RKP14528.1 hypothetical protein BJ684DRAFT_19076 [Piptocephalis cylindrospora]
MSDMSVLLSDTETIDSPVTLSPASSGTSTPTSSSSSHRPSICKSTDHLPAGYLGVLTHAITGAARAYIQTLLGRGGLTFFIKLLAVSRGKLSVGKAFRTSFGSEETRRFAATFGLFAFLWKAVNNGIRVARGGRVDPWNGAIAGGVAGLAILAEAPERRLVFAQQLLVRAVQAMYNHLKDRNIIHFPQGDTLLFTLASAQVLYAYTMRPHTLDPTFYRFMVATARVPGSVLRYNESLVRGKITTGGTMEATEDVLSIARKYHATPKNLERIGEFLQLPPSATAIMPCDMLHLSMDNCLYANVERWIRVARAILPVNASLNLVPTLLFRFSRIRNAPGKTALRMLRDTLRSSSFLATFVTIYQMAMCFIRSSGVQDRPIYYWLAGAASGLSIQMETKGRRSELALYVLPKAADAWMRMMVDRRWIFPFPHVPLLLSSVAMSILMSLYQEEPGCISPLFQFIIRRLFGRN